MNSRDNTTPSAANMNPSQIDAIYNLEPVIDVSLGHHRFETTDFSHARTLVVSLDALKSNARLADGGYRID